MLSLYISMFVAGLLTILLPCILPLVPIVLGVSIAGRSKWRPLFTILGMLISFVGFTFLLLVALNQFVELADYIRISTYYVLLLFGLGFATTNRYVQLIGAIAGGFFFWDKGWIAMTVAQTVGATLMELGGKVATRIQQLGTDIQQKTKEDLGQDNPFTALIIGLTMGLVWVPCAGPALGFAFTLVREQPGPEAAALLFTYGVGTALPLLIIGYGGQAAVHSAQVLSKFSGHIKHAAGVILIISAVGLNYHWFRALEIYLVSNTSFGNIGVDIERKLFGEEVDMPESSDASKLPKIVRAPEFSGLGPWHNSEPLTLESLRGKVVLVDFWTYSCINCIRTLPYLQEYWDKYNDTDFVLIGVHSPEFVFEKSETNVAHAIEEHGLTYPVAQDNDFATWKAFNNRYWPAKYLIDADGYIRYTHFGEGAYEETDKAIEALLVEAGALTEPAGAVVETEEKQRRELTAETYLGERSWPALQNRTAMPTADTQTYKAPENLDLHKYALVGDWRLEDTERQVLVSDEGEIRMKFLGGEINLVLGPPEGRSAEVTVLVDGEETKTFTVDFENLYALWSGEYGEHDITLKITGAGLSAYAFTFGS